MDDLANDIQQTSHKMYRVMQRDIDLLIAENLHPETQNQNSTYSFVNSEQLYKIICILGTVANTQLNYTARRECGSAKPAERNEIRENEMKIAEINKNKSRTLLLNLFGAVRQSALIYLALSDKSPAFNRDTIEKMLFLPPQVAIDFAIAVHTLWSAKEEYDRSRYTPSTEDTLLICYYLHINNQAKFENLIASTCASRYIESVAYQESLEKHPVLRLAHALCWLGHYHISSPQNKQMVFHWIDHTDPLVCIRFKSSLSNKMKENVFHLAMNLIVHGLANTHQKRSVAAISSALSGERNRLFAGESKPVVAPSIDEAANTVKRQKRKK